MLRRQWLVGLERRTCTCHQCKMTWKLGTNNKPEWCLLSSHRNRLPCLIIWYNSCVRKKLNPPQLIMWMKITIPTMWWMKITIPTMRWMKVTIPTPRGGWKLLFPHLFNYLIFNVCENSYSHNGGGIDTVDLVLIFNFPRCWLSWESQ